MPIIVMSLVPIKQKEIYCFLLFLMIASDITLSDLPSIIIYI